MGPVAVSAFQQTISNRAGENYAFQIGRHRSWKDPEVASQPATLTVYVHQSACYTNLVIQSNYGYS